MISSVDKKPGFLPSSWQLLAGRGLWALTVILALSVFAITLPERFNQLVRVGAENQPYLAQLGLGEAFLVAYIVVFDTVAMLAFCIIAAVIVWRRTNDWVALLVSATMILMGVMITRPVESLIFIAPVWKLPFSLILALGVTAVILFMFLFPDGRFVPSWSRWVALGWSIWVFAWYLTPVIFIRPTPWPPRLQPGLAVAGWVICGMALQIYRYRNISNPTQRQQIWWVVLGIVASSLGFLVYLYLAPTLIPVVNQPGLPHLLYILIGVPVLYLSLLLLPISLGISISRYRLWDIGVFINRTLVYGALTVMLTGIYLVLVLSIQAIFRAVTGQTSPLAVALSTLATAAFFYPLRRKIQTGIDRRLFPRRYEAVQVLATLHTRLNDELDLTRLTDNLETIVAGVLQPASALTWLRTPSGYRVHLSDESTSGAEDVYRTNNGVRHDGALITHLQQSIEEVIHLESLSLASPALQWLQQSNVAMLMLLRSRGELLGWLSLGPRLNGQGYSIDDFHFLKQVAVEAGPAVRSAQLALDNQKAALESQRMGQQLSMARLVQHRLLPHQQPEIPGWQVCTHYQPAQAIGGDFYDFINFEDGRYGLIIGDVSDKGIPAALLMASARSILRAVARQFITPGIVLQRANQLLLPDIPEGLFITCLYALLDPTSGHLSVANAGHNPPIHCTGNGVTELWVRGMPLGWLPDASYEEKETTLAAGDRLLAYSDGITETRDRFGEMFGTDRLKNLFCQAKTGGPELIDYLMDEVLAFGGPKGPDDDVAIVALHRF